MSFRCNVLGIFSAILAGLLLIDIVTTTMILNRGGTELNPLMAVIVSYPWLHLIIKLIFAIFVVLLAFRAENLKQHSGVVILIAACTIFLVVAIHNIRVVIFTF